MVSQSFEGTAATGRGHSSTLPARMWQERSSAIGLRLVPGSLNLHVLHANSIIDSLGEAHAYAHRNSGCRTSRLWRVRVTGAAIPHVGVIAVIIRGTGEGMDDTIELVGEANFKERRWVKDGDRLSVALVCADGSPDGIGPCM